MTVASLALLLLALDGRLSRVDGLTGHRISRVEGGAFVAAYVGYLIWLVAF